MRNMETTTSTVAIITLFHHNLFVHPITSHTYYRPIPYWRVIKRILHISAYSLLGAGYNEWFYTPMLSALEQLESKQSYKMWCPLIILLIWREKSSSSYIFSLGLCCTYTHIIIAHCISFVRRLIGYKRPVPCCMWECRRMRLITYQYDTI